MFYMVTPCNTTESAHCQFISLYRYAVWWTMAPASVIVGLCAAPLWTAQCSYFTLEGGRYAALSKETETAVVTRFFGIFFCFFQMCEYFRSKSALITS